MKCKSVIISLPITLNMCFGCSKEQSDKERSFLMHLQDMFLLRNDKKYFQLRTLIWKPDDVVLCIT